MDLTYTIYSKTGKGTRALSSKAKDLPNGALKVLPLIDGKTDAAAILSQLGKLNETDFRILLSQLEAGGYIRAMHKQDWDMEEPHVDTSGGMVVEELFADDFFSKGNAPAAPPKPDPETAARQAREEAEQAKRKARAAEEARLKAEESARLEAERLASEKAVRAAEAARLKQAAEAQARAEAERAVQEAKRKAEEEARFRAEQTAKLEAERLAREKAERKAEEARIKAEAEAIARAEAERIALEERQAREAEEAARRKAQEAAERVAQETRRKAEEEARLRAAEEAARLETERIAREKAEREAEEARIRAETEAKARAEAERAVLEAQRKAEENERARAAEVAAKLETERIAREKAEREAEKARLRAEAEARARAEAERMALEERQAREAEEIARRKEQEEAERAALEAQHKAEEEARGRAEEAAKLEAERIAREKYEREQEEARIRAEAETRAKAEEEARNAREEAQRLEHAAEIAQLKAEVEAREQAEKAARTEAERLAREADDRRAQEEKEARRQAEAERKAQQEAERLERKAEADEEKRRTKQEAQQHAEEKAREKAERKEREQAERLARKTAAALAKRNAAGAANGSKVASIIKSTALYLSLGLIVLIAGLHFVNLAPMAGSVASVASESIGEPVQFSGMRASLLPRPQLTLTDIRIGHQRDMKLDSVKIALSFAALFDEIRSVESVEITGASLDATALTRSHTWFATEAKAGKVKIAQASFSKVEIALPGLAPQTFDGRIELLPDGTFGSVEFNGAEHHLTLKLMPDADRWQITVDAGAWQPPVQNSLKFDELHAEGTITGQKVSFDKVEGSIYRGKFTGRGVIDWSAHPRAYGSFEAENIDMASALAAAGSTANVEGSLRTTATFSASADSADRLLEGITLTAKFTLADGKLGGVDLASSMLPANRDKSTRFESLAGNLQLNKGIYYYRNLLLKSSQLNARGSLDVHEDSAIDGKVSADLTIPTRRMRADFALGGRSGDVRIR